MTGHSSWMGADWVQLNGTEDLRVFTSRKLGSVAGASVEVDLQQNGACGPVMFETMPGEM